MYKPYYESYKNGEPLHFAERKVEKISDVLYKHYTSLEELSSKFANEKRVIYKPINIKDYNRIYNV